MTRSKRPSPAAIAFPFTPRACASMLAWWQADLLGPLAGLGDAWRLVARSGDDTLAMARLDELSEADRASAFDFALRELSGFGWIALSAEETAAASPNAAEASGLPLERLLLAVPVSAGVDRRPSEDPPAIVTTARLGLAVADRGLLLAFARRQDLEHAVATFVVVADTAALQSARVSHGRLALQAGSPDDARWWLELDGAPSYVLDLLAADSPAGDTLPARSFRAWRIPRGRNAAPLLAWLPAELAPGTIAWHARALEGDALIVFGPGEVAWLDLSAFEPITSALQLENVGEARRVIDADVVSGAGNALAVTVDVAPRFRSTGGWFSSGQDSPDRVWVLSRRDLLRHPAWLDSLPPAARANLRALVTEPVGDEVPLLVWLREQFAGHCREALARVGMPLVRYRTSSALRDHDGRRRRFAGDAPPVYVPLAARIEPPVPADVLARVLAGETTSLVDANGDDAARPPSAGELAPRVLIPIDDDGEVFECDVAPRGEARWVCLRLLAGSWRSLPELVAILHRHLRPRWLELIGHSALASDSPSRPPRS